MKLRDYLRRIAGSIGFLEIWRGWRWRRQVEARRRLQAVRFPGLDRSQIPVVFGNAMSKSGSQMLAQMLEALVQHTPLAFTDRHPIRTLDDRGRTRPVAHVQAMLERLQPADIAWGYLPSTTAMLDWFRQTNGAMFFLYRDPRDRIVSHILYAMNIHEGHAMRDYYHQLPSMEERISQTIVGVPGLVEPVNEAYASYRGWFDVAGVLPVRFEDLIQSRPATLRRMLQHLADLGVPMQADLDTTIAALSRAMSPEHSPTFRKGQPGDWREHFSEENLRLFQETAGDLLQRLGYQEQTAAQDAALSRSPRRLS